MNRALIAGVTAAAFMAGALGFAAVTAQADDGMTHGRWCPGDPKNMPYVGNYQIDWDWSVCHTWWATNYRYGNVTMNGQPTSIWDGDDPPPEAITRRVCPPIAFMCP